jgi:hypothetical protein
VRQRKKHGVVVKSASSKRELERLRRDAAAGDEDALLAFLELTGMGLLGEVLPNLAKFIGGALAVANMPECVCKILEAMLSLFAESNASFRTVYANEVIRQFRECADLPWISSVEIGASELANAVGDMSASDRRKVVAALRRTLNREDCK